MRSYLHEHVMLMKFLCMHETCRPQRFIYFSIAQGHHQALYKELHAAEARPIQKGGCLAGLDSRALWVELAEMLNIP